MMKRRLQIVNSIGGAKLTHYLGVVQIHAVHGKLLGVFQEVHLGLSWCNPPGRMRQHSSDIMMMLSDRREYAKTSEIIHRFIAWKAFWEMVVFMACRAA